MPPPPGGPPPMAMAPPPSMALSSLRKAAPMREMMMKKSVMKKEKEVNSRMCKFIRINMQNKWMTRKRKEMKAFYLQWNVHVQWMISQTYLCQIFSLKIFKI